VATNIAVALKTVSRAQRIVSVKDAKTKGSLIQEEQ